MTSVTTSEQQYHQADGTRTRTPSPREDTYSSNIMSGSGSGGEVEVPSPIPASISSSSSEPSHSQHGSSGNMSNYGGGVGGAPVPNLFALNTSGGGGGHPAPPMPSSSTNGWGVHAYETGTGGQHPPPHPLSAGYHPYPPPHHHQQQQPPPPPFQGYHQLYPGPIPMVVSTPAPPPLPNSNGNCHSSPVTTTTTTTNTATSSSDWARNESCPNFSIGTTEKSPTTNSARTKASSGRRRSYTKSNSQGSDRSSSNATTTTTAAEKGGGTNRRQKRLERNRESARLSRRRRKHYLEILEERVTQLSTEVDQGRRAHAALAVPVVVHKRREVLLEAPDKTDEERVRLLQHGLGRTSAEMMLVNTFKYQQLKSFALPAHSKFVLWLTLQNDQYFRGGRAASERLSAARIGERMLHSGNDRVAPGQSMWPLVCNEIGLSYDQEERVRTFQRNLLQAPESWLERHSARAADLAMTSVHDSTQALNLRLGQRERSLLSILTPAQKVKFLSWAEKNREKLDSVMKAKVENTKPSFFKNSPIVDDRFRTDKNQHVAANLYIINYRLQKVLQHIPRAAPLVTGLTLKKLSRRPSFESLGRSASDKSGKDDDGPLSRENSFASSGSLKRSASVLSMDGERPHLLQISPDDAEETCKPTVDKVLGYLKVIIPDPPAAPQSQYEPQIPMQQHSHSHSRQNSSNHQSGIRIPSPALVTYHQLQQGVGDAQAPPPATGKPSGHKKQSSFIPPHLNVVPEDMFPNDGTADDFLMSLVDEDWAIGGGVDMDTSN